MPGVSVLLAHPSGMVLSDVHRLVGSRLDSPEVFIARSISEATQAIQQESLGLAIVDLEMDGSWQCNQGLKILYGIRERFPNCYNVLVATTVTNRESLDGGNDELPVDYFVSTRFVEKNPMEELGFAIDLARGRLGTTLPQKLPLTN